MPDDLNDSGTPSLGSVHSILRYLIAGVVVLNLMVVWIAFFSLKQSRSHYDDRAAVATQNLAKILEENLTGIIAKVDIGMLAVVDEAERQLAAGAIQGGDLSRCIMREHSRLPEIAVFRATDVAGDAIYGPEVVAAKTTSLAHRDYFRHLKETPGADLVISEPLIGGISGKWMIVLARRFNRPDGTFAGLVYSGVTLNDLTKSFSDLDVGINGSIALVDSDGKLVARHPIGQSIEKWVGRKIPSPQLMALIDGGQTQGTHLHRSSLDSMEKIFSMRRVGLARPFFILVGFATRDYLAGWRTEVWKLSSFTVIFLGLSILSAVLIQRGWRRNRREIAERLQAQIQLTRQKEDLEAILARTKRLEGIISICMHCKKINNQRESWEQLEKYISEHTDALFSHGICPDCFQEHYPFMNENPHP